ncbi:alpha-galactosidase [Blautia schinkii]|nr:alpha-galactosidase [Blautia schinkii]
MEMIYRVEIPEEKEGISISWEACEREKGITDILVRMKCEESQVFPKMTFKVIVPAWEIHYLWTPKIHLIKALNLDWFMNLKKTNGFTGAPVISLIGNGEGNRATFAVSDTLHAAGLFAWPLEETGEYSFQADLFEEEYRGTEYEVTFRLDTREVPYYESLRDTALWWEEDARNTPAFVPAAAKEPMYSTWYSFHQRVSQEELLLQCRLSGEYGLKTILLDDGWQTDDNNRGYAYCGDWQPAPGKIADMRGFVDQVHELGMKVMTWYSVPFIGEKSANYGKYKDMVIDAVNDREWYVLDPRYPEVREFLITTYENALRDFDLDGFKLDFVDEFVVTPFSGREVDERRDFRSFSEAADFLMKECIRRLKAIKPDILLEFRQTYNGPLMRSYGNIFRAVDCPFDDVENHLRVTDVRLLAGSSAVHSDMLMWHPGDSVESAALQMIQILFSVPQISVRLETLSESHKSMLKFYCGLWEHYKDAFLNGSFRPNHPKTGYSVILGEWERQMVCTYHSAEVIRLQKAYDEMVFVNGTDGENLCIWNECGEKEYRIYVYDCMGNKVQKCTVTFGNGLQHYSVPGSGVVIFKQ